MWWGGKSENKRRNKERRELMSDWLIKMIIEYLYGSIINIVMKFN